jgi:hypothetical protein
MSEGKTGVWMFSRDGPGGAVGDVGGEGQGPDERVRVTSVVEEAEGREGRGS